MAPEMWPRGFVSNTSGYFDPDNPSCIVPLPLITDHNELSRLCDRLQHTPRIGLDTEFVSEDTFYPELCLLQVATSDELVVIDAKAFEDLSIFWKVIACGEHVTIMHAAREELNFMLRAVGEVPKKLFDVQIAAGFCSREYPSSYSSVVGKFLGHKPAKGEQRTDWRKRPLSAAQITYAMEDVRYLLPLEKKLTSLLQETDRLAWYEEEVQGWMQLVIDAQDRKDWRRLSGIGKLNPRSLAIVRELWLWRQQEAERRDRPAKRLLRDDLIVELARRKVDSPSQIMGIRGMERSSVRRNAKELAACVRRGLEAPVEHLSRGRRKSDPSQLNLLGQFLAPALGTICRRAEIAASLVGTASNVRELIAYRLGFSETGDNEPPILAQGWRAELVGNVIDELLEGKRAIRINNAKHEDPLVFEDLR